MKIWGHRAGRLMDLRKIHLINLKMIFTKIKAECTTIATPQAQAEERKGRI
jgi:hypothetical protein